MLKEIPQKPREFDEMAPVLLAREQNAKAMSLSPVKLLLSKRLENPSVGNGSAIEPNALLTEPMFLRALCLERKRAERSRKLFVLMVLDPGESFQNGNGNNVRGRIVPAVLSSIRETDIAGWYKEHSALGVIFAELGTAEKKCILTALRAKITAALRSNLRAEELDNIHISFHCFPEDPEDRETGPPTIAKLYPDLVQRDESRKLSRVIKRAMDVAGSSMAFIILLPIFLAISSAIKLSSSGPILFRQKRIGQ